MEAGTVAQREQHVGGGIVAERAEVGVVRGGEDHDLVRAGDAVADDRVLVGHHPERPTGRVGLARAASRHLGRCLALVAGAERAGGDRSPAPARDRTRNVSGRSARAGARITRSPVERRRPGVAAWKGQGRPPAPRSLDRMAVRLVIIGGGPAGNTAATVAASIGADVTMIERDIVGGAAHLWDCIPSKAMVATGNELAELGLAETMGLEASGRLDVDALRARISGMEDKLRERRHQPARVAGRPARPRHRPAHGRVHRRRRHRPTGPRSSKPTRSCCRPDRVPRVPDWATVDGERILTTRQAYPPPEIPEHLVVIGSGVTGVEFTHMFSALGSRVTLIVSRQQVLPYKDPEVAAVLEDEFLRRGVKLLKGARAISMGRDDDKVFISCDDGRAVDGSHALLCIGSVAEQRRSRLRGRGRRGRRRTATSPATGTARRTSRTSTRRATSPGGCRCRRSRRCRAARSPST